MSNEKRQSIDDILHDWAFEPGEINVRLLSLSDRKVIQMRIDLGILQLEVSGRPDGARPNGFPTYLEWLSDKARSAGDDFEMDPEMCQEVDREFQQYYHRRVSWLQLKQFDAAIRDAEHTLKLMDLCKQFSPDEEWTISHEQFRPLVLYHRTKAEALRRLEEEDDREGAVEALNRGLAELRTVFIEYEVEDKFDEDELVTRLIEFREMIRSRYGLGKTIHERLAEAIATEQYELAAELRDEITQRSKGAN